MALWDTMSPDGQREMIVLIVRFVIITVAIMLRFVGKFTRDEKNRFWWDDFWILVGWCFNAAAEATTVWGFAKSHGGMSVVLLVKGGDRQGAEDYLLGETIGQGLWHGAVACVCISILCFYLRIFQFEDRFRYYVYALFVLCVLWGIGSLVSGFLLCSPPSNFWKMIHVDQCASYNTYLLAVSLFEIVITTAILALPVRPVLKLSLDLRTRLTILGIFFLGGFVVVTEIIRVAIIYRPDVKTPNMYRLLIWSAIHITSAFVCACLPVCKPVWQRMVNFSKSIVSYPRSLTRRVRSRGHSRFDPTQAPGSSSGGSKKTGSSSSLRRVEVVQNKNNGDSMVEEYGRWRNGDLDHEASNRV